MANELQALVDAVRAFRNEPALGKLLKLRGTAGYIGMVEAWERAADALAAGKDASPLAGSIGGGVPFLNTADMADLERIEECFADGEGYDVPKERMQRLAELGVVRRHNGSHYSISSFGRWVLGKWRQLPLETVEEASARSHAEMAALNGIGALPGPDSQQPHVALPRDGGTDKLGGA